MEDVSRTTKNAWNRFLLSPAGLEGMLYLRERMPEINSTNDSGIILEAGVGKGYRRALDLLSQFTAADPTPTGDLENR